MGRFEKGHTGRPKNSRNKLAQRVFDDVFRHWCEPANGELCKGQAALEMLYREEPAAYLRLTASVLPKEFTFDHVAAELDDGQIDELITHIRERLLTERQKQPEMRVIADAKH
jgi:hypothetical protein